jgi:hypothetical protein
LLLPPVAFAVFGSSRYLVVARGEFILAARLSQMAPVASEHSDSISWCYLGRSNGACELSCRTPLPFAHQ